jgi:aspartyl-tRNA(Asn)/glutamyl-tRNA(Gln) amidotransferase subunit A
MAVKNNSTLKELSLLLSFGEESSVSICSHFISKIENLNSSISAILEFDRARIMKAAEESDMRRKIGKVLSPYDGIPIAVKDNICVEGERCSCASKILRDFVSPYDATVIKKMKNAGLIPLGRTNMDEFAMGSSCENSAFMKTVNPWDRNVVPGGSSGGSAAAVAASLAPAALGSDTGGSIRQPAAFCGVVGLKPSYGKISRYGLVAFASSLDQIGPITNSVSDARILMDIISGHDEMDSTSLDLKNANFAGNNAEGINFSLKGKRIGIPSECIDIEGLDGTVRKSVIRAAEIFKDLGAEIKTVSLPHWKYSVSSYYVIATAEASANLARFDGIRYGLRKKAADLIGMYSSTREEGFGEEVKRRILLGTFVLSSGYYDAYYLRAQKARTLIRQDYKKAFADCDVILSPVTPTPAFKFGSKTSPLQMYLSDIFTISVNLAGNCAINVPAEKCSETGLPVSIQLTADFNNEALLLGTAEIFEKNRPEENFSLP